MKTHKTYLFQAFTAICFLWLTGLPVSLSAQTAIDINGTSFMFQAAEVDHQGEEDENIIKVFRKEAEGPKYLLSHTSYLWGGDCNSEWMEVGNYRIRGNQVIFYTAWDRKGDAMASPIGFRKQVYEVNEKGKLVPISNQLWLDTGYGYSGEIAVENARSSEPEVREEGESDIERMETEFGGTIIRKEAVRESVRKEVEKVLAEEIAAMRKKLN